MPTVQFFGPYDMSSAQVFEGTLTGATATQITITDGAETSIYGGSFTYPSSGQVSGTLTSYEQLSDGSILLSATGLNVSAATASSFIDSGQVQSLFQMALQGSDALIGSPPGGDTLEGFTGNDIYVLEGGSNTVIAGNGLNTAVINTPASTATITASGNVETVKIGNGVQQLTNVERVQFSDSVVAFDIQGDAGNAYRLYQAAFDRTPDVGGLSYWVHQLDEGMNFLTVAQSFVNSAEFKSIYGAAPTSAQIVNSLYENVLGRAGDPSGTAYWVGQLNSGGSVAVALASFAQSAENHSHVDPAIVGGITLGPTAFLA